MNCKYKKDNLCQLTELFNVHVPVNGNWCKEVCGPDDTTKQLTMLERLGYRIPPPPNDEADLCDWAKDCILDDKVELLKLKRRILAEIRRQELLEQLPKGFQLADNLKNHLGQIASHYIKTRRIKVSDEHRKKRLAKCDKCPSDLMIVDDDGVMRCAHKKCGCYLNNPNNRPFEGKADFEAIPCDMKHWEEIDAMFNQA